MGIGGAYADSKELLMFDKAQSEDYKIARNDLHLAEVGKRNPEWTFVL